MTYLRTSEAAGALDGLGCGDGCSCTPCRRAAGLGQSYHRDDVAGVDGWFAGTATATDPKRGMRCAVDERRIYRIVEPPTGELVELPKRYCADPSRTIALARPAYDAYIRMKAQAEADGIPANLLTLTSGYRSVARQKELWAQALREYGSPEKARKWVAPPGGSPHHTGRAIDLYLGSRNKSSNVPVLLTMPAYHWLVCNAVRFGFTPYLAEPWHWEYNPDGTFSTRTSEAPAPAGAPATGARGATGAPGAPGAGAGASRRNVDAEADRIFHARHPERGGRPIGVNETAASREWREIRNALQAGVPVSAAPAPAAPPAARRPTAPPAPLAPGAPGAPAASAASGMPADFRQRAVKHGWAMYGGGRLEARLRALAGAGRLRIGEADIDTLARIADVESGGKVQAINTWDNAVVSFAFMQWTLRHGELQDLIARVPQAFARHGIRLGGEYTFGDGKRTWKVRGIDGVADKEQLRGAAWARRFFVAGLDDDIVIAVALKALDTLRALEARVAKAVGAGWTPYPNSAPIRALVAELHNNRPAYVVPVLRRVVERTRGKALPEPQFVTALVEEIVREYLQHAHNGGTLAERRAKAERWTGKVLRR